ncbi:ubiquitin conjugation factor E4 A-like isoform X1 [Acipenser ruthenus]|uniref:ubiquitin conjugation factor E4 A-like isoform X1 n=1 Tax=Acipenser ruthenus TaxID=7906 RepID=UPI002740C1B6|nr:ubiquitin conjugation factor E4 A-like isoform X1 [Acipenser ruthenus]XP_058865556.1 ubiquitin conjugation factor E4 A-like isoform X1 [Acipenser ruthenus]
MTDQGNNNNQNLSRNPFAALFSSVSDAKDFASVQKQPQPLSLDDSRGSQDDSDNSVSESVDENDDSLAEISRSFRSRQELCEQLNINHMIQRIFLLTLDNTEAYSPGCAGDPSLKGGNGIPPRCIYLEEMASDLDGQDWLDMDNIEQALFNRMLLPEPGNHLINMTSSSALNLSADRDAGEKRAVPYLFSCFQRAKEEIKKVPEKLLACAVRCKNLSVLNARTVLLTPEIYVGQNVSEQLLNLLLEAVSGGLLEEVGEFLDEVIAALLADQEVQTFGEVMVPLFEVMLGRVKDLDLCQLLLNSYLDILVYFSKQPDIARVFVDYIQPKDPNNGLQYQKTLLGAVLNISCLLKTPGVVESHGYFLNPSRSSPQETKVQESNIHQFMAQFHDKLFQILKNLLQLSPDTRHRLLTWLGGCLHANAGRAKIWANQMPEIFFQMYASDAFFLNLGAALLRLCQPFCRLRSPKLLTFNPTYCALKELNEEERRSRNVHVKGLDKETTLIPAPQNQEPEFAQSYNLLTENLILTQYALHLGFHRLHDQMVKMNQSLHRLQGVWREAQQSASPASEQLREQFERLMTVYLSTKAAATEPHMLQGCLNLQVSTATVLVHFSLGASGVDYTQLTFPLPALENSLLCYVPEFFADSLGDFFIFLRRFADEVLESSGPSLEQILDFVTVFMGNVERLKNPHLRAKLAEVLEAVMPHLEQVPGPAQSSMFQRERAFCTYQHAAQLAEALITVFVDIEFTGDPHQFEQKFNYRRPMYPILKYMWGKDSYRESIKSLARYASENLEAMNPPLFLRFLNLLMNDAIFLLDEAIQYLSKIKVLQIERDRGEWDSLTPDARREKESSLQMFGQLARFHNIMSNETIGTLAFLTSEIKCLFAHPFLAERIISMLNYFLQHLVGPKMGALKVKDFTEFDFKPQQLVSDICTIYLNLGNEENFCSTVPKDGRSYSPRLFAQMVRVLKKINKPGNMIVSFSQLADKIKSLADQQLQDEETYADAPDEFLDPIMSTLMLDPVLLPSSRVTVDRSTIARHLLSDQTDPFSRSPLTMDQIRSNTELKERIQQWLAERKQKRLQTGQSA